MGAPPAQPRGEPPPREPEDAPRSPALDSNIPRRYRKRVTGAYTGTTDEILQWGAYKWGFAPDVFRAIATIESWWKMSAVGDEGRSFGIMQVKRGPHCCYPATRLSTAFNVDYYGAWLRSVYDGRARWLNTVPRGERYRRGDLWGSIGVWYSGRWHKNSAEYIRRVKRVIRNHVCGAPASATAGPRQRLLTPRSQSCRVRTCITPPTTSMSAPAMSSGIATKPVTGRSLFSGPSYGTAAGSALGTFAESSGYCTSAAWPESEI